MNNLLNVYIKFIMKKSVGVIESKDVKGGSIKTLSVGARYGKYYILF